MCFLSYSSIAFSLNFVVTISGVQFSLATLPDLNVDVIISNLPSPVNGGTFSVSVIAVASPIAITSLTSNFTAISLDVAFAISFQIEIQVSAFTALEKVLADEFLQTNTGIQWTILCILVFRNFFSCHLHCVIAWLPFRLHSFGHFSIGTRSSGANQHYNKVNLYSTNFLNIHYPFNSNCHNII